jgi:cold shock CspA family protein
MAAATSSLTRVGVFYDGNYFFHVSNYYHYYHDRKSRISVSGLHDFIRKQVADSMGCDEKYVQIVDAHYFRGRPRAQDAEQRGTLLKERVFDDVLVREGVVTHYLPLGPDGEKGIDVWLSLEAYELAIYKRFDVSVLVACDGDFLPLVRKLNTLGTRVMLLGWDFKWTDQNGSERETRTAQVLLDEVTYPIMMHQVIDDRARKNDPMISRLFVPSKEWKAAVAAFVPAIAKSPRTTPGIAQKGPDGFKEGVIHSLKQGFGFIRPVDGGETIFFYHDEVTNADFSELQPNEKARYKLGSNAKGVCAIDIEVID